MTKNEQKAKYSRIANDPSQLEMFKDDVIDGTVNGLPDAPEESYSDILVLKLEEGELKWEKEGSGPTPPTPPTPSEPVQKGDFIFMSSHLFKVLDTNEDNSVTKLMLADTTSMASISEYGASFSGGQFILDDGTETVGLLYEGSTVDQACEAFVELLSQDVQDAIIEQEYVQSLYDMHADDPTIISNQYPNQYRIKKIGHAATIRRSARLLDIDDMIEYMPDATILEDAILAVLRPRDIYTSYSFAIFADAPNGFAPFNDMMISSAFVSEVSTNASFYIDRQTITLPIKPVIMIDLTQVEYSK